MSYAFSKVLSALPASTPFVGPETLERQRGAAYLARIGANESAFGVSPAALEVLRGDAPNVANYCDPEHYDLRSALAQSLGISWENLIVAEGIDGVLGIIVRAFVDPGDKIVTSLGAYPTFNYHVTGYGGELVFVPYRDDWHNDAEALVETARKEKAKLLYLANPDNPMGSFLGREALQYILDNLPADCLFLLDEAYGEFAPADDLLPVDIQDRRLIRLRTFSKAHGLAGMRCGYGFAHRDLIAAFNKIRLQFGVGRLAQRAALAALGDGPHIQRVMAQVAEALVDYARLAEELGLPYLRSYTNFLPIDAGREERSQALVAALHERGVFIRRPGVPRLGRFIRVTAGRPEERALFAESLRSALKEV